MSDCGQYLQGFLNPSGSEKMIVLDISSILCRTLNPLPIRMLEQGADNLDLVRRGSSSELMSVSGTSSAITLQDLAHNKVAPGAITAKAVNFATNENGMAEMSMLRQFEQEGAVVLYTLSENGVTTSETITRLPEDLVSRFAPVLVKNKEYYETVRLVLNPKPRSTYNFRNEEEVLPIVLERTTASIPVTVVNVRRMLD